MLIDYADRCKEMPGVINMVAAPNPRTKDLECPSTRNEKAWRDLLLSELKISSRPDMRFERVPTDLGGVGRCSDEGAVWSGGSDAVRGPEKKKNKGCVSRAVEIARMLGAGNRSFDDEEKT